MSIESQLRVTVNPCQNPVMELKDVLLSLREREGWDKSEAARRIGMDRSQYVRLEQGSPKRPEYETLVKLAKAYAVKPVTLIEATGQTIMEARGKDHELGFDDDELVHLFRSLTEDDQARLVVIANALYQLSREK